MPDETDRPEALAPKPERPPAGAPPALNEAGEVGETGDASDGRVSREVGQEKRSLSAKEEAGSVKGEEAEAEAAVKPSRFYVRRFTKPGPRLPWWRLALPTAGLALCVGCLWGLLNSGPWPSWQPWWTRAEVFGKGLVIIDPGHGGGDSGAVAQGVVEKDLNLDVGLRVGRALRARGVTVRLTREDDHFVPLEDRVRFANALPGAVFVSIHFNDAAGEGKTNPQASGIETYYCEHKLTPALGGWMWASLLGRGKVSWPDPGWAVREGQRLADCVQGALIAGTGAENRGIKERSLYVTHRVLGPAVLVEGGFVSHPGEARRLGDPTYRQVLAESIAEGIVKYLRAAQAPPTNAAAAGA